MCTWNSLFLLGNASWIIGSGSAKPPYNGPQNDHTLGLNIYSIISEKKIFFIFNRK
jgi:hypothetical protein